MNRAALLCELTEAREYADRSEILIESQKRLVACQSAAGIDTAAARQSLEALEHAQGVRLAHIDQLLNELDKLPFVEKA